MVDIEQVPTQQLPVPSTVAGPRWRGALTVRGVGFVLTVCVVVYLAIIPLITMVIASVNGRVVNTTGTGWTLSYFRSTVLASSFGRLLWTSCLYAGATAIISVVVGFGLAWIYVRTDTPGKVFALLLGVAPLVIPGVLSTVAWGLLLTVDVGPANKALAVMGLPQFNIYSMAGMIFIQVTHVVPIAFLIASADLASIDNSLEEAATVAGASRNEVFRRITWPVVRPALLGAAVLIFVQTLSSFEVPELIGVPAHRLVFGSKIYSLLGQFPADYSSVGVMGVVVLAISGVGMYVARRLSRGVNVATIGGKAFKSVPIKLGRWRWLSFGVLVIYAIITVVLPLAMLIWSSILPHYNGFTSQAFHEFTLSNYKTVLSSAEFLPTIRHTLIAAVGTGVGVVIVCGAAAFLLEKSSIRGRAVLDAAATAPIAIPSIVMGIGVLFWYLVVPTPIPVYGTILILILCFITVSMPYGMRFLRPAVSHIDSELDEAARVSGARSHEVLRRIYVPILLPAISGAFLFSFIVAFRELSASLFLFTPQNEVVAVQIYQLFSYGEYTQVCALGVVVIVLLAIAVMLISKLTGGIRRGWV